MQVVYSGIPAGNLFPIANPLHQAAASGIELVLACAWVACIKRSSCFRLSGIWGAWSAARKAS